MPSTFTVKVLSIATDGTNIFLEIFVSDGTNTQPLMYPVFQVGTSAAEITAYLQAIADNRPVLDSGVATLVGTSVTGA